LARGTRGHEWAVGDEPPQRPIGGLVDADARSDDDRVIGDAVATAYKERWPLKA
jgi:hypothetical protein